MKIGRDSKILKFKQIRISVLRTRNDIKFWNFIYKKRDERIFNPSASLINIHVIFLNILPNKLENSHPRLSNVVIQINERCFSLRTRFHGIVHWALNHREWARSKKRPNTSNARDLPANIFQRWFPAGSGECREAFATLPRAQQVCSPWNNRSFTRTSVTACMQT